ncbi:MAG: SMP-30/gluconolactonase/LRE family protein [Bacteroidota bacterium]
MNELIPEGAEIEVLARGFVWSEGPLWLPDQERVIFSDVPQNTIFTWKEGDQGAEVYLQPSGFTGQVDRNGEPGSNGLALDQDGQLLLCQHGDRRLAKMNASLDQPEAQFTDLATHFEGQRFNSPNDLCVSKAGLIYFTDPPYGLEQGMEDPSKEIAFQGVYRIGLDGQIDLITDSLSRPNGIALSPDNRQLYVAVSDRQGAKWYVYDLDETGHATAGKVFFDVTEKVGKDHPGLPDGLKVNEDGVLFATGPGGVWVFESTGEHVGTIETGLPTANCALGEGYLYMTADSLLLRVPLAP